MSLSVIKTLKYILLLIIFGLSTSIGMAIAKAYGNRVDELKEFKNILNIMKTKIKFTYEPLGEIFRQIAKDNDTEIEKIFGQMANQITYYQAKDVWENCIQDADISIKQEDKNIKKINEEKAILKDFDIKVNDVKDNRIKGGISVDDTYIFNPIKYINSLVKILEKKINIYENVLANDIKKVQDYYLVSTSSGVIKTKIIVVACHYPFFIKII